MSPIDDILQANARYAGGFPSGVPPAQPSRRVAVLACMDARIPVEQALGLRPGEAHILRNAGGVMTEDVLRSFIVSHHLAGTRHFMVINHTDCGMLTFRDDELRAHLRRATGSSPDTPAAFHAFTDLHENVRRQIRTAREHPWFPAGAELRGFIYDVKSGRLTEVPG